MREDHKGLEAEYRKDYEDLQSEYDASAKQHTSELRKLRSRHANEIQSREAAIMELQHEYDQLEEEYDQLEALHSRLLFGEQEDVISAKLSGLVAMSEIERNAIFEQTSLGKKSVKRPDLVEACAKTLRDQAKLGQTCRERLTDFLMLEGF